MSIEIIRATISTDCEREKLETIAVLPISLRAEAEQAVAARNVQARLDKSTFRYYTNMSAIALIMNGDDLKEFMRV